MSGWRNISEIAIFRFHEQSKGFTNLKVRFNSAKAFSTMSSTWSSTLSQVLEQKRASVIK